jgi:hypothetical protein
MQTQALSNWTPTTEATGSLTPWPLTTAALDKRRATRKLDQILGVYDLPDLDATYPHLVLREVAA